MAFFVRKSGDFKYGQRYAADAQLVRFPGAVSVCGGDLPAASGQMHGGRGSGGLHGDGVSAPAEYEGIPVFLGVQDLKIPVGPEIRRALAESCDLMNMQEFFMNLLDEPEAMEQLMDVCMEQSLWFAREQVKAGADMIGLGDAASSLIGHSLYEEFALPYQQKMIRAIHDMGAKVKLHICGNVNSVLDLIGQTGTDIIDLDFMVDIERAADILPESCCICGNFNPVTVMYQGTPELVKQEVRRCKQIRNRNRNFISAGCEIPRDTPLENMVALKEAIEED